nr:hypothetical protein L203_04519 [Cryptococcus depauperatus CBS 7841]
MPQPMPISRDIFTPSRRSIQGSAFWVRLGQKLAKSADPALSMSAMLGTQRSFSPTADDKVPAEVNRRRHTAVILDNSLPMESRLPGLFLLRFLMLNDFYGKFTSIGTNVRRRNGWYLCSQLSATLTYLRQDLLKVPFRIYRLGPIDDSSN